MAWTEDRVKILKRLWGEGNSASQIANELGGMTRNAVIGKVHRLGLANRATASKSATTIKKPKDTALAGKAQTKKKSVAEAKLSRPKPTIPRRIIVPATQPLPPQPSLNEISPEVLERVSQVEKKAKKLNLLELTERTCKWPVGDPATDDFWFCGLPSEHGKPYCEAHIGVAFQPANTRKDTRR